MKYFELFGLEPKLDIDEKKLKEMFFALSRATHPDFFTLSNVQEQMESMEKATLLNTAYKTLKNENTRIRYILEAKGFLSGEGNESMPSNFLMEMMDLNENIAEARIGNDDKIINALTKEINQLEENWTKEIQAFKSVEFKNWTEDHWQTLKGYYLKQRYLRRLRQQLEGSTEM